MTPEEQEHPKCTGSSEFDWSLEDAARALVEHRKHPKRSKIERALGAYQAAINVAWGEAIQQNVHGDLIALWLRGGGRRGGRVRIPVDEAQSEVVYILRTIIARFNTDRVRAELKQYACKPVMLALGVWAERRLSSVALPRDHARTFGAGQNSEPTEFDGAARLPHETEASFVRTPKQCGELDALQGYFEETHGRTPEEIREGRGR